MERTSLNNGAPFPDYVSPISETNSSKDDAFYSSILVDPNSQNPLENYERIKKEQEQWLFYYCRRGKTKMETRARLCY